MEAKEIFKKQNRMTTKGGGGSRSLTCKAFRYKQNRSVGGELAWSSDPRISRLYSGGIPYYIRIRERLFEVRIESMVSGAKG